METETTTETGADTEKVGGEGEKAEETVSIPKGDYDKLNQTLGSLKRQVKDLTKPKEEPKETEKAPEKPQSDEVDYKELTLKSFLKGEGVAHPDDQKIVRDEAKRLSLPIDEVIGMEHIKTKLEAAKEARTAQSGMVKGKGRGSGTTQNDVDYWVAKGELPPDQELAEKVVDAKIKKEQSGKMFSDDLY